MYCHTRRKHHAPQLAFRGFKETSKSNSQVSGITCNLCVCLCVGCGLWATFKKFGRPTWVGFGCVGAWVVGINGSVDPPGGGGTMKKEAGPQKKKCYPKPALSRRAFRLLAKRQRRKVEGSASPAPCPTACVPLGAPLNLQRMG